MMVRKKEGFWNLEFRRGLIIPLVLAAMLWLGGHLEDIIKGEAAAVNLQRDVNKLDVKVSTLENRMNSANETNAAQAEAIHRLQTQ